MLLSYAEMCTAEYWTPVGVWKTNAAASIHPQLQKTTSRSLRLQLISQGATMSMIQSRHRHNPTHMNQGCALLTGMKSRGRSQWRWLVCIARKWGMSNVLRGTTVLPIVTSFMAQRATKGTTGIKRCDSWSALQNSHTLFRYSCLGAYGP